MRVQRKVTKKAEFTRNPDETSGNAHTTATAITKGKPNT